FSGDQRVAAEREEIVTTADARKLEDPLPDLCKQHLRGIRGRGILNGLPRRVGFGRRHSRPRRQSKGCNRLIGIGRKRLEDQLIISKHFPDRVLIEQAGVIFKVRVDTIWTLDDGKLKLEWRSERDSRQWCN